MSGYRDIARAYQSAVNLRSLRDRDAEVFEIFASRLRDAEQAVEKDGEIPLAKALADNAILWQTVTTITLDTNNPQPVAFRKSMLALAASVIKEMNQPQPNIRFLVEINGNIAAGLRGVAPVGDPASG